MRQRGVKNLSTHSENRPMDPRRVGREIQVATIRASCPTCGDVELTTRDVTVQVCSSNNQGSYAFRCPHCRLAVSKLAEARIVDLLVSSGVRLSVWHMPAELEEPRSGAPISYDDLLEFHFQLQQEGWFERMVTSTRDER
jgi:hypothetical protein